ncbi:MAG TPA: 4-phosphoerythronate dehydrogenase PdxB [Sunxiuqinia sp.]|nr:4-phosphoerythronate dehydrogenase PdxB [Sunxiuqinia sp.]
MKFIIDDKIPYIKGALEPFGEVVYLPGAITTADVVKDADALITRTRTACNKELLEGSSVKFIATATIGFDHIDTDYCQQAGIEWTNAPGCNSKSVEQYMASALFVLAEKKGFELKGKTIGIVGVGQVGSKVANVCELLGMRVLLNDPPRERFETPKSRGNQFVSLQQIMEESDIITFHVPLNMKGKDATYHMANDDFYAALKRKPIEFNTCRGEVTETEATKAAIKNGQVSGLVIDCWEHEPNIDLKLLEQVDLATPHIAGYSKDGKANGTTMSVQAISRHFKLGIDDWQPTGVDLPEQTTIQLDGEGLSEEEIIKHAVLFTYDIREDDRTIRKSPETFEKQRGNYPVRREYPVFSIEAKNIDHTVLTKLKTLGFKLVN